MKKYSDINTTPLSFHRLFSHFILPLNSFLSIYSLFSIIMSISVEARITVYDLIVLVETSLTLVLTFSTYRGMMRFKKSSYWTLIALLSLKVIDNIFSFVIYLQSSLYSFSYASLLGVALAILVFVYYYKRRELFVSKNVVNEEATQQIEDVIVEKEDEESVGEYDCPRCGLHITNGAVFCPRCGAQMRKVRN